VRANLLYGHALANEADRWMNLDEAVAFLGIGHLLDRWPPPCRAARRNASRSAAPCSAARVLLMDEPLSSLDRARREEIMT
jgi:molybdate transport system ATP-binding protein